jgi:serine/threonine-protein kinase RsbW
LFVAFKKTMRKLGELKVRAALENVPPILDCVGKTARAAGLDDHTVHQIQVAVDEACANVVEHAYCGMPPGDMQVTCSLSSDRIVIRVRDWGHSFEPALVAEPDISAPLEERDLGGLGLFLIRRLMDDVQFTFDPQKGNEVLMVKHLSGDRAAVGEP